MDRERERERERERTHQLQLRCDCSTAVASIWSQFASLFGYSLSSDDLTCRNEPMRVDHVSGKLVCSHADAIFTDRITSHNIFCKTRKTVGETGGLHIFIPKYNKVFVVLLIE